MQKYPIWHIFAITKHSMKIAYCIAGHTREFHSHASELTQSFMNMGADIFISTWNKTGTDRCFWQGDKENEDEQIDSATLVNCYKPKKFDIEQREDYQHLFAFDRKLEGSRHNVNTLNTLLMFKKISIRGWTICEAFRGLDF